MGKRATTFDELVPLVELCRAGKLFEVQEWIGGGHPVNPPDGHYRGSRKKVPLEYAIDAGFHSLVKVLLEGGTEVGPIGGYCPMRLALEKRRLDLVELLVDHGYDPNAVDMPASIRHAQCDLLPNVPLEPVIVEGAVVHGRVTHEVIEDVEGWQFKPACRLWRDDKRFLFGFGIPFSAIFATMLTWVFHDRLNIVWPAAILCGTLGTAVSGGSAFLLVGMILRAGYRRLCSVRIPRSGGPLEIDAPIEPDTAEVDLTNGLKWMLLGDVERQRLVIPRELLKAVQLCPWRFVAKGGNRKTSTWAVQGLLVLGSAEQGDYHRLPILLTSDFIGAARLMQLLASTLHVPYLFCADAEGWQVEELRAKKRPPLRAGGIHT